MIDPLNAIHRWYKTLPKNIAGLVASRIGWTLAYDLEKAEESLEDFEAWLSDGQDNPFANVAKAGHFRTVFAVLLAENFDPAAQNKSRAMMEDFIATHPETSAVSQQWLQLHEFSAAQWLAQKPAWEQLVDEHLSDQALQTYIDTQRFGGAG